MVVIEHVFVIKIASFIVKVVFSFVRASRDSSLFNYVYLEITRSISNIVIV